MTEQPTVYVTRAIPEAGLDQLRDRYDVVVRDETLPPSKEHIVSRLEELDAEGLVCLLSEEVDATVLDASPDLSVVSTFSVGYDHIDLTAAAERGIAVTVTRYGLDDLDRAIAEGHARGFVKILTAPGKDRILGATLVGDHAGELLAEVVLAMKYKLGLNKLLGTIHAYPTWAEANKFAAGQWKKAHAPERVLALLERYHRWRRG